MKFLKNKYFAACLTSFVIFIIASFFILSALVPDKVFVTQSDTNGKWIPESWQWLVTCRQAPSATAMENPSARVSPEQTGSKTEETVYLCGIIPVKTVSLSITDTMSVIPGGECIGINLKTRGLLVVGLESFRTDAGQNVSPGMNAGIKKGDIIESVNGTDISRISSLQNIIISAEAPLKLEGSRNGKKLMWTAEPEIMNESGKKCLGIWLRESVAGVGTLTFFSDGIFGALGHAIADVDTGSEVTESGGTVCPAAIIGIDKGEKGIPGALKGIFAGEEKGKIISNSPVGIFGTMPYPSSDCTPVALASRKEIRPGKAQIISDIGNGKKYYDAEIQKVFPASTDTKSMVIRITDKELIDKTGGIVQGMSGSPVVQNGKLVGAVTHVFVNDPTRGYGIFIENMLAEAERIK